VTCGSEKGTASVQRRVDAVSGKSLNGCHPHPPYSPDLAPHDFFPITKNEIEAERTIEEIQTKSKRVLDTLTEKDFQEAFQK
jgi:hypothetical protein